MNPVTLSIVSHGHGPMLERLLDDLVQLGLRSPHKVVLTLNLADELFDASRWPDLDICVIRNDRPQGFGSNHNAAFLHCQTPWFAVLNPDLRCPSDPFPRLIERASNEPNVGVIAPRIVDSAGQPEDSLRTNLTPWSLICRAFDREAGRANAATGKEDKATFAWLAGMFLLFPSHAFRRIGGFDARFFLYCEDYDICARLHCSGFRVLMEPGAVAIHDAQRTSRRSARYLGWHVASLIKVWTSSVFWRVTFATVSARSVGKPT